MSRNPARTTGQKRKHDEINAMPSPGVGNAQSGWNGAPPSQYDPAQYQNGYYQMGQYDPQVAYAMQAQAHAAAMAAAASTAAATNPPRTAQGTSGNDTSAGGHDRTSVNQLKDAMSMGGVSLREEEEYAYGKRVIPNTYTGEDRSLTQDFLPESVLIEIFKTVCKRFGISQIQPEVIALAGLAVEQRVRSLIEKVNTASSHRWDTQAAFSSGILASGSTKKDEDEDEDEKERIATYADGKTPVFDRAIRRDVMKQLIAVEKLEKAEEMRIRRERKERQEQARQASGAGKDSNANVDEDEDGPPKKRKKRAEGPGVQAKNMSEETKKKLSNTVANAAAGFGNRYAWMNTGTTVTPRRPTGGATGSSGGGGGGGSASANAAGSGWSGARKKQKAKERSLSMRDVLFVIEREKGHGGGKGSARGWS